MGLIMPVFVGRSFRSLGFSVNGKGDVQSGAIYPHWTSTGGSKDVSRSVATVVAPASVGSGWNTDSAPVMSYDDIGGTDALTGSDSGAVEAVSMYRAR